MTDPAKPSTALIAEDEPILAAALRMSLARLWPELDIIATCGNGDEALREASALQPDILFLDIKMPGLSGLQVAEELAHGWTANKPFPQIVFVTAYDEFALAAFEHAAADYVLKPVSDARMRKTVERLQQRLPGAVPAPVSSEDNTLENAGAPGHPVRADELDQLAQLLRQLGVAQAPAEKLGMIRAAVGNQVRMIPIGEVMYFEALDKYVNVVTADSEALIRTPLKDLLPQLDSRQFWQIHRGTIVNAACIASAVRDEAGKLFINLRASHTADASRQAEQGQGQGQGQAGALRQLRVSPLYGHLFRQM
jgi:DNA-binding LytR/AlgR family response regulator